MTLDKLVEKTLKKIGVLAFTGLLALTSCSSNTKTINSNQKNNELYFKLNKIETVNIHNTSAFKRLNTEAEYFPVNDSTYVNLENLLENISKDSVIKSLSLKDSLTFNELKIYGEQINKLLKNNGIEFKEEKLIGRGINNKKIDCDIYSTIYKSIFEMNGIKSNMMPLPGHVIVSIEFDYKGKDKRIFYESTSGDFVLPVVYEKQYGLDEESMSQSGFLKPVIDEKEKSHWLSEIASEYLQKFKINDVIKTLEKSVEIDPNNCMSQVILAGVYSANNDEEKFEDKLYYLLDNYPNVLYVMEELSQIHLTRKELDKAEFFADEAIKLNSNACEKAYEVKSEIYRNKNDEDKSKYYSIKSIDAKMYKDSGFLK